ncbi:hypothetical protein [Allomuricauda sp. d1]|uniref:hypothetical protein n=1 Tax=Allomuricauda sp. d1 TaxID=3136725 RepID=UPI0031DE0D5E
MDCLELNPIDDFSKWEEDYVEELNSLEFKETLGNRLLFEDKTVKLWDLKLEPGQRMPFLRHNKNFSWISETNAVLKSRFGNGKITLIRVGKGDTEYFEHAEKNYINDLENLGDTSAIFKILEYKQAFHDMLPILN